MTEKEYDRMYARLYRLFDGVTPLKADCGLLCGKACCGGDANTGMLLFPGEKTALEVREENGERYALCGGKCVREERPLSCRIFPLFPLLRNGVPFVTADPRGANICPLVRNAEHIAFNTAFVRRVYVAAKILSGDEKCRDFLDGITQEINDIITLDSRLRG